MPHPVTLRLWDTNQEIYVLFVSVCQCASFNMYTCMHRRTPGSAHGSVATGGVERDDLKLNESVKMVGLIWVPCCSYNRLLMGCITAYSYIRIHCRIFV